MAVGSVNAENAQEFIKCGCPYLGVGSGMFRRADVSRGDPERLRADVGGFEMAVSCRPWKERIEGMVLQI